MCLFGWLFCVAKANQGVIIYVDVWTKKHLKLITPCFAQRIDKRLDMTKIKRNVEVHVNSCGPRGDLNNTNVM